MFLIAPREIPPGTFVTDSAPPFVGPGRIARYFDRRRGNLLTSLHLAKAGWIEHLAPMPRMRILFSKMPDWESNLIGAFQKCGHQIEFAEFTPESVRNRDLVVPLTIEDLLILDGMRDLVERNPIPIPSPESVRICNDKQVFEETLIAKGFSEFLPGKRRAGEFPYILKRNIDAWGRHCGVIHSMADEPPVRALLQDPDYLQQRHIPGQEEFTTHVAIREDQLVAALNIRYRFSSESPVKGRSKALTIHPCTFSHGALFREILLAIGFQGLCCFNYKLERGKPMILEINPRFGGSLGTFFPGFLRQLLR